MKKIHIYHLNDLHSHFENWPKIRRFLNSRKAFHQEQSEDALFFDIGDFLDRVHPLTEATDGQANIELMNTVPFDAVTIGNNEGIGNPKRILNQLYDHANVDVVLANLFDIETQKIPDWAEEYVIRTTTNGVRVGIIGLTAPLYLSYLPNGWQPKESYEILPELLKELSPKTDIVILLSHMGIIEDEHMAEMYEDIDLIIGAHTHHVLPTGRLIEQTLLTGGGKWGTYVGHTTFTLSDKQRIKMETELIDCSLLPDMPEDANEIEGLFIRGENLLRQEEIMTLPFSLKTDWNHHTALVDLGLDAITQYAEVQIGILNSGLFLDDLPKGTITKQTLHHVLPHPMKLIVCRMNGRDFKEMIWGMEGQREELRTRKVMGMGFRGKVFGELCYKGIEVLPESHTILYAGKKIMDEQELSFVTVDHYRYVDFFPSIENKGRNELLFPYFLREVVGWYLEEHVPIMNCKRGD